MPLLRGVEGRGAFVDCARVGVSLVPGVAMSVTPAAGVVLEELFPFEETGTDSLSEIRGAEGRRGRLSTGGEAVTLLSHEDVEVAERGEEGGGQRRG